MTPAQRQRDDALARSAEVRGERRNMKKALKHTDRSAAAECVAAMIRDPPPFVRKMGVAELLLACPWIGVSKASRMLRDVNAPPALPVGALDGPHREALARLLEREAAHARRQAGDPAHALKHERASARYAEQRTAKR